MNQFVLTPNEARVLSVVYKGEDPTLTQVAVEARLIPDEAESVSSRLVRKKLVVMAGDGGGRILRLTDAGRFVGQAIEKKNVTDLALGPVAAGLGLFIGGSIVGNIAGWLSGSTPVAAGARVFILPSEE